VIGGRGNVRSRDVDRAGRRVVGHEDVIEPQERQPDWGTWPAAMARERSLSITELAASGGTSSRWAPR